MGSLWATKNVTLDEEGVIKLSPRMVNIFDNTDDADFDLPVAFGRTTGGTFYVATKDEPFNVSLGGVTKTIAEDAASDNPNLTTNSHGVWWQNRFYESTATTVSYNSAGTWTADVISSLTSGVRHYLAVFKNKNSLAVANGNTVKLYNTSHSNTVTLTLPADYEVIGLAYNYYKLGIITRLGSDSSGQNSNSYFFTWDGVTTEAGSGVDIGAYTALGITPYKSSFAILSGEGQLLYWNGGGLDVLASFPFYFSPQRFNDNLNFQSFGDNMIVDGDTILINVAFDLDGAGEKSEKYTANNPSGIWCYDPSVGLYHKFSPSISKSYNHWITSANVDTTTNILTTSGTIPATGNPIILAGNGGSALGGIQNRRIYYVIKLSATTFAFAETKELALAGVKVDITSAATNNYIWMYDIVDYGATRTDDTGAIAFFGAGTDWYTQIIGGTALYGSDDAVDEVMFMAVPFLDNVGYAITPKMFSNSKTEKIQSIVVKHRILGTHDKIIVKSKMKDYAGLPLTSVVSVTATPAIWTSNNEFHTTTDLSDAKTVLDSGEELEIELVSGMGAGQMSKIVSISDAESGVTSVVLTDEIVGAGAGLKSQFVIDNWKVCDEINVTNQTEGLFEVPISKDSKAPQFKFEFRGIGTAIEDILIINKSHIPAV